MPILTIYKFDTKCRKVMTIEGTQNDVTVVIDTSRSMSSKKTQASLTRVLNAAAKEELVASYLPTFRRAVGCLSPNGSGTHLIQACEAVYGTQQSGRIIVFTDGLDNDDKYKHLSNAQKAEIIQNKCPGLEIVWILLAEDEAAHQQMKPFRNALIQKKGTYAVLLTDEISPRDALMLIKASKKATTQDRHVTGCLLYDDNGFGSDVEKEVPETENCDDLETPFDFSRSTQEVDGELAELAERQRYQYMPVGKFVEQVETKAKDKIKTLGTNFEMVEHLGLKFATILSRAIVDCDGEPFEASKFWGKRMPLCQPNNECGGFLLKRCLNGLLPMFTDSQPRTELRLFSGKHKEDDEDKKKRVRYDVNPNAAVLCKRVFDELKEKPEVVSIIQLMNQPSKRKRGCSNDASDDGAASDGGVSKKSKH